MSFKPRTRLLLQRASEIANEIQNMQDDGCHNTGPAYDTMEIDLPPSSSAVITEQFNISQTMEDLPSNIGSDESIQLGSVTTATKTNARKNIKRNYCKYCQTMQTKISRHFCLKHKNVPEIITYMELTDPDPKKLLLKKREACKMLIHLSNKEFNEKVINKEESGSLIAAKKSSSNVSEMSHVVCSSCGALITRKYFCSHTKSCKIRQSLIPIGTKGNITSSLLLPNVEEKYKILKSSILNNMKKDKIKIQVQNDTLILEFGRRFLKGHMDVKQKNYVSSKLRTLGDLLLRLKQIDPSHITEMADCVDPTNFNKVCEVVRDWSAYNEQSGICKKGSVPRRICKSLKVCSHILWSEAIKNRHINVDEQLSIRNKHEQFLALMETDWSVEMNSAGDKSLKLKKIIHDDKMPLDENIGTFFYKLSGEIPKLTSQLQRDFSVGVYNILTRSVIAFLIAFNGRRPSEVTYATTNNYANLKVQSSENRNDTVLAVFTVAATKNDVKVPILVPPVIRKAISILLERRSLLHIEGDILLCKTDGTAFNGSSVLSQFASQFILKKPKDFTANGLRHYWATVSQLHPAVKAHMPKFLGHAPSIHHRFYEQPSSEIHLNVIGPLLVEKCLPSTSTQKNEKTPHTSTKGGSNSDGDMAIVGLQCPSTSSNPNELIALKSTKRSKNNRNLNKKARQSFDDPSTPIHKVDNVQKRNLSIRKKTLTVGNKIESPDKFSTRSYTPDSPVDDSSEDPDFHPDVNEDISKTKQSINPWELKRDCEDVTDSSENESLTSSICKTRNNWLTPEKQELFEGLPLTVLGKQLPGRGKVKEVWEKSKLIRKRHSLQTTRIEISKYYRKKKKVPTPIKERLNSIVEDQCE